MAAELMRGDDLGGDFATPLGQFREISLDDAGEREEAAIGRYQTDKFPRQLVGADALDQGRHDAAGFRAADHGIADKPLQINTFLQQPDDGLQVACDLVQLSLLVR